MLLSCDAMYCSLETRKSTIPVAGLRIFAIFDLDFGVVVGLY